MTLCWVKGCTILSFLLPEKTWIIRLAWVTWCVMCISHGWDPSAIKARGLKTEEQLSQWLLFSIKYLWKIAISVGYDLCPHEGVNEISIVYFFNFHYLYCNRAPDIRRPPDLWPHSTHAIWLWSQSFAFCFAMHKNISKPFPSWSCHFWRNLLAGWNDPHFLD